MGNLRIPFEENSFYHIYNHGNGDEDIFRTHNNYDFFLKKYVKHIVPICETYAYCLLPNHFHFLVQIKEAQEIKKELKEVDQVVNQAFSNLFNSYTKSFNTLYNRRGSLFLDNFKRNKVENEDYLTKLIHYIHYNPIKHGFTKTPQEWKFSSYRACLSSDKTYLERDKVLRWFGGLVEFIKFHQWNPEDDYI
jgi:putative transposase